MAEELQELNAGEISCSFDYDPILNISSLLYRDWEAIENEKNGAYKDKVSWKSLKGSAHEITGTKWVQLISCLAFNRESLGGEQVFESVQAIETFIKSKIPIRSPEDKMLSLLEYIYDQLDYAGDRCGLLTDAEGEHDLWRKFYFVDREEMVYYVETLHKVGWIVWQGQTDQGYLGVTLSIDGLRKVTSFKNAQESRYCFVAMSFQKDLEEVYEKAIRPAVEATHFIPIRIDKVPMDTVETINAHIIANIKKARFTIADFTGHRPGVYFEAGYAQGRGQTVIFTCKESEMKDAHFDTRNTPHLTWETTEELQQKLTDTIRALIEGAFLGN